jgi:hypothetical protein
MRRRLWTAGILYSQLFRLGAFPLKEYDNLLLDSGDLPCLGCTAIIGPSRESWKEFQQSKASGGPSKQALGENLYLGEG